MENFDLHRLFKVANNLKLYFILALLLILVMGYFYSFYYVTPMYQSSATVVLVQNSSIADTSSITQSDIVLNQNLLSTYTKIAKSNHVLEQVIKNLSLTMTEEDLLHSINVSSIKNTEVFKITVTNNDPNLAASIANEVLNVFSKEVQDLYHMDNVYPIDLAEPAITPYNIHHAKDMVIFFGIGIFLCCGITLLVYLFDTTIKSEKDIEDYVGLPVLSSIPLSKKQKTTRNTELITHQEPKSPISECFKTFRTNIMFSIQNHALNTILVTSGLMGEGKSFVSSNLAVTFSQSGKRVIIIDTDMRKGRLHKIFGKSNTPGLSNCLAAISDSNTMININEYITKTDISNLHIMTCGDVPPNPSELLSSTYMKKLLSTLNTVYDIVICDGTPCMLVSDSIILSQAVDTTVIVTSYKNTKMDTLQNLKKSIEMVGGHIGGVILNQLPVTEKTYKNQYYYGEHISSSEKEEVACTSDTVDLNEFLSVSETEIEAISIPKEEAIVLPEFATSAVNEETLLVLAQNMKQIESQIESVKQLYKTTSSTLNAEHIQSKLMMEELSYLKNNYMQTMKEQLDSLTMSITSDKEDNSISEKLLLMKTMYESNVEKQEQQFKLLENQMASLAIPDSIFLEKLTALKETYENAMDSYQKEISVLFDKINSQDATLAIESLSQELEEIKTIYEDSLQKQSCNLELLSNQINSISFDEMLNEFFILKNSYTSTVEHQSAKLEELSDKIDAIEIPDSSILLNEIEQINIHHDTQLEEQKEKLEILLEKMNNLELSEDSEKVYEKLKEIKAFYESTLMTQEEQFSALEDRINAISLESIFDEFEDLKDFYDTKMQEQKDKLEELSDKIDSIEITDSSAILLEEFSHLESTYLTTLEKQSQQILSLAERMKDFEGQDFKDSFFEELNGLKETYHSTILMQEEKLISLENKLDNFVVSDSSSKVFEQLVELKDSYHTSFEIQEKQIDCLVQKIDILEKKEINTEENNTSVLQELSSLYAKLDNINARFDTIEERVSYNQELIRKLSNNLSPRRITLPEKEKIIDIKDYFTSNEANIVTLDKTSQSPKKQKTKKDILEGQLNMEDVKIAVPEPTITMDVEETTIPEIVTKEIAEIKDKQQNNKQHSHTIFGLFNKKKIILDESPEEETIIVSQILLGNHMNEEVG